MLPVNLNGSSTDEWNVYWPLVQRGLGPLPIELDFVPIAPLAAPCRDNGKSPGRTSQQGLKFES